MYNCEFPNCAYKTAHRTQINNHHIVPVENGGSDKQHNRIFLCPTHHTKVFIEGAHGMHSIKGDDSISINGWFRTTGGSGRVLEYMDSGGNLCYQNY